LRALIDKQIIQVNFQIPAQLAQQRRVDSLEVISAIPVEIPPREIQILANLILGYAFLLENLLDPHRYCAKVL